MNPYKFTAYFENEVLRKRPYLKREWCIRVLQDTLRMEQRDREKADGVRRTAKGRKRRAHRAEGSKLKGVRIIRIRGKRNFGIEGFRD